MILLNDNVQTPRLPSAKDATVMSWEAVYKVHSIKLIIDNREKKSQDRMFIFNKLKV
jgi:hypothetical protein